MHDYRFPRWRGWTAAILLLVVAMVIAFGWPRKEAEISPPDVQTAEPVPPAKPQPLEILDRSALLEAAAKTASDYAAGKGIDDQISALAGRRFELVLPLGCGGPLAEEGPVENGWRYDADSGILQAAFPSSIMAISNYFDGNSEGQASKDLLGRGFWIEREWLRDAVCPVDNGQKEALSVPVDNPSVAIGEIETADAPRANDRDGADYRVSKRVDLADAPDDQGLRIVISGRLMTDRNAPIQCESFHKDQRPVCLIFARFDRVALTNASGAETYGEWRD